MLLLGHPTYALTVVIFSLLVSSGLGSFMSVRIAGAGNGRLRAVLAAAAALIVLLAIAVQPLLSAGAGLPLGVKIRGHRVGDISGGIHHGNSLPRWSAPSRESCPPAIRWAWSLNAAASVLGSVTALVLALYLGLVQTMLVGGGLYLCALAVLAASPRRTADVTQPVPAGVSV